MEYEGYESEKELILAALEDDEAKEMLRTYVEPAVRYAIGKFLPRWGGSPEMEEYLVIAGMSNFEPALETYVDREENLERPEGAFPLYFIWWAREAAYRTYRKIVEKENLRPSHA